MAKPNLMTLDAVSKLHTAAENVIDSLSPMMQTEEFESFIGGLLFNLAINMEKNFEIVWRKAHEVK